MTVAIGCQNLPSNGQGLAQPGPDTPGATAEEDEELAEIKELLQQTDMTVNTLAQELERRERQARDQAGPPNIVKDLWPAQRVLADAIQAARAQEADKVLSALDRLQTLVQAVRGDLPVSRIIVRCERALAYLSQDALNEAAVELSIAYDIAHRSPFPTLVPGDVASMIQTNARSQISAGRPRGAATVVETILGKCYAHGSLAQLERVSDGLAGARVAVERGAWPVVEAELFEVHRLITDLAETLNVQRWGLTAGAEQGWAVPQASEEAPADEAASADAPGGTSEEGGTAAGEGGEPTATEGGEEAGATSAAGEETAPEAAGAPESR